MFEHLEMFRHGGERNPKRRGELGDATFTFGEPRKHCPAGFVGKCVKNAVEALFALINHVVEYSRGEEQLSTKWLTII